MARTPPWFTLPTEDEKTLADLIEKHGTAKVLAVLSRLQLRQDRLARVGKEKADEALKALLDSPA